MPTAVLVHLPHYQGPTDFQSADGRPLVPIVPMKSGVVKHGHYLEREQLPMTVAWAITIHKSQSLSLDKVVISLGRKEMSPGLSYVGASRSKTTAGLAFDGPFSLRRLQRVGGGLARFRADAQARASMTLNGPEPDEYFVHS
jgi:ATP-dependent DNA helicase PIF1